MKKIIITLIVLVNANLVLSQDRFLEIENKLNVLSGADTSLASMVNISVMDVTLHEFLRGLAISNGINLSVSPKLNKHIVVNFNNVNVKSVLIFLAREHDLDIKIIGNIISIEKFDSSELTKPEKHDILVEYFSNGDLLSVELKKDTLSEVAKKISKVSGKNVLVSPGVENETVSAYINKMPFESVLKNIGISNGLVVEKTNDGFYVIKREEKIDNSRNKKGARNKSNSNPSYEISKQGFNRVNISAFDANISELINDVSNELKVDYFLLSKVEGNISIFANNVDYEAFLSTVLQGLEFTFKKEKNIYIIGSLKSELETTYVYEWKFRSVEKITEFIPATYKSGIEIIEFHELNSVFITGKKEKVEEVVQFMHEIDRPVPLIAIEVIIVDVTSNNKVETGIEAGLGENPNAATSKGGVFPVLDLSLGTQSINGLINNFNGLGWVNLGKVTPQFYLSLKALEENGDLEIKSTPKLSTLNGHEATLISGETKYYGEEQQSYYGSQNPALSKIKKWQAIEANLTLKIKPIVSSDDQITLSVDLAQSEFTPSTSTEEDDGPPGKLNRSFNSLIRVKDEEIVLLGGLERNTNGSNAKGVPFLSRIPIIKHLFSSTSKTNTKSKLSIFIKPTILK